MPDAGYFGLTYELLFEGDVVWTDITSLVDSRTTKVDIAGCSEDLKSVISKCSFEMRYNSTPSMTAHSMIVSKILTAKQAGENVLFRMGGLASFVGKVDLGSFSQKNGRIPGFLTVTCEDNSYLLDEVMATSFEYPDNSDLDDEGYPVFDKNNLAQSIAMLRFLDAGYTLDQIDLTTSDSITEKVRRVVYDADDERTYRDMLDTLLFEHCAVIYTTPEGKLSIRRLYRETPTSERNVDDFLVRDGITTGGGDYQFDGVKVVWSNLGRLDGAVVYNANITMNLDEKGDRGGEEIQSQHYWPEDGDIEETWQEFDATFLDREYQTKISRLKNKDLSLISVKNAYYEVDKDAAILLANNPPEIEPTKARVLWWNSHESLVKKIYGFTIVGDALFRSKLNDTTYPTDAKKLDEPYETEYVYDSATAQKLVNHLHRFRKHGDLHHKWTEIDVDTPMFQVVTVSAPDTLISSLGMVISQSLTFPAPNKVRRSNSAIGITAFSSEPVRTRSIQLGGAPVNTGPAGENGMRSVVQYALGTIDAPYTDGTTKVGTELALVGTSIACLGTDNSGVWTTNIPSPTLSEYVWRREGYYISPATFPTTWEVTRLTGNKGDSAVHGELSNDSHTIPTDVNGDNGNFTGCETTLHMYVGGADDSDNWTYSAGISAGVTASLVDNTLTVTAMTTDTGYVDITASKSGYDDMVRRFSLSKSKQGAVGADATAYWLVSSVAAVKKTQASAYVPATVTFSSKSQTGNGSPAYYDGRFVISESTDGLAWTVKYTSASDEHTKEYTPSASIVAIKCEFYQSGGTVLLLDEETVPIVLDGTDGAVAQGIYLTASRGAINVTSRGTVYGSDILISAVLQNLTGTVTWSVDIGTGTLIGSDNLFRTLDISTVETDEIVIKATVGGFSATYGFAKVYDGMPAPLYLGKLSTVTTVTSEGEPLIEGDFFLVGSTFIHEGVTYKVATLWEYSGSAWIPCTDGSKAMMAMDDYSQIASQAEDGVFNQLVAKRFIAQDAVIKELMTKVLTLETGGRIESKEYEAGVKGVQILANGILSAVKAKLVDCEIDGTGNFRGAINSLPLTTTFESDPGATINFNAKTHWWQNDLDALISSYALNTIHTVSGSLDGGSVTRLLRTTGNVTLTQGNATSVTIQGNGTVQVAVRGRVYYVDYNGEQYNNVEIVPVYKNGALIYTYSKTSTSTNTVTDYFNIAVSDGDVITFDFPGGAQVYYSSGTRDRWSTSLVPGSTTIHVVTQSFTGAGTRLLRNGVWDLIPPGIYSTRALVLNGLFDYSTKKRFAKGDAFVSGVQSYTSQEVKPASGDFVYNNTSYAVIGVMKTSTGMSVFHANGFIPISASPNDYSGFYDASGSFAVLLSIVGAAMTNIEAKASDTYSIGLGNRFLLVASKTMNAEAYNNVSSIKYKKDIEALHESALVILRQIEVVTYRYNSETDTQKHTGYIAENTPQELTGVNHDSMSLGDNIGMLIKAVQELDQRIQQLEAIGE